MRTANGWTYTAGHARPGQLDGRLRGRHDHAARHSLNAVDVRVDHVDRRRHDADRHAARSTPDRRRAQRDRHAGRPGIDQPGLDVRPAGRPPCSSTAAAPRPSPAAPRRPPATCRRWSSTSPRARSPWPARCAPRTAGRTPRGRSTRAARRSSSRAARSRGSHSLNAVDVRATTSIAAGTTLTVDGLAHA